MRPSSDHRHQALSPCTGKDLASTEITAGWHHSAGDGVTVTCRDGGEMRAALLTGVVTGAPSGLAEPSATESVLRKWRWSRAR
ncbi:hypothetical protein [Nonomuraea sp. NPDC050786]|uniref:hypothetical protein n=1 Tax=Nonomuraea sp. NPDC050786 TaxID=3154840 RepID=UPI0033F98C71